MSLSDIIYYAMAIKKANKLGVHPGQYMAQNHPDLVSRFNMSVPSNNMMGQQAGGGFSGSVGSGRSSQNAIRDS